jgi:RNA polymerase sigma factor (sigma-70 family)
MDRPLSETIAQVRAAKAGDRTALDDLLRRYLPWVRQTVALRLGQSRRDLATVDDLVQESLVDAFRSIDSFREQSEGSFRHWMAKIVLNNVRDHGRRNGSAKHRVVREAASTSGVVARDPSPSQCAQSAELEERLEQALLAMTGMHREILILRDRCGMSYEEIADQLGYRNADTARALHHRAMTLLDDLLLGRSSDS